MEDGGQVENNDFIVVNDIKLYPLNILNIKPNYYISKNGDIYNKLTNKFLGSTDKDGYHIVSLKLKEYLPVVYKHFSKINFQHFVRF